MRCNITENIDKIHTTEFQENNFILKRNSQKTTGILFCITFKNLPNGKTYCIKIFLNKGQR